MLLPDVATLDVTPLIVTPEEAPKVITPPLVIPRLAPDPDMLIGPFFERI